MKIDIIADTVCPWCFIGKKRFERALELRPIENLQVGWRAFQLNPAMPPEGVDRRQYVAEKFGGMERARTVHNSIMRAAVEEGFNFNFNRMEKIPNTVHSHRLIRYAANFGAQMAVVEAVFGAYFLDGRDIGDIDVLSDIADEAGLDRGAAAAYLESDVDIEAILSEDELARRLGVNGVPCFIVNRKYAVSGAQSAEVLIQVFALASQEEQGGVST